jgi:hypothetical protein
MRFDTERFPWYIADLGVYLLLNIIFIALLHPRLDVLKTISPFAVLLFGLAVYRIANIISNEAIAQPIRAPFVSIHKKKHAIFEVPKKGNMGAFGSLIYCPSCTGVWIGTILVYTYLLWPGIVSIIILIFAVSSVERLFTEGMGRITK